jgi:hypothetical protein
MAPWYHPIVESAKTKGGTRDGIGLRIQPVVVQRVRAVIMSSGWPGRMAVCFRGRMNWAGQAKAFGSVLSAHPSLWSAFHRLRLRNGCGGSPRRLVVAKANSGETLRHPCSSVPSFLVLMNVSPGTRETGFPQLGWGVRPEEENRCAGSERKLMRCDFDGRG